MTVGTDIISVYCDCLAVRSVAVTVASVNLILQIDELSVGSVSELKLTVKTTKITTAALFPAHTGRKDSRNIPGFYPVYHILRE